MQRINDKYLDFKKLYDEFYYLIPDIEIDCESEDHHILAFKLKVCYHLISLGKKIIVSILIFSLLNH